MYVGGKGRAMGVGLVAAVVLSGCALFDTDDVSSRSASDLATGMRPVPTVPPAETSVGGTAAPAADPEAALVPTETEVIGDPQPDPDSPDTLPPLPESPAIDGCTRIADLLDPIGAVIAVPVAPEAIGADACRLAAGPIVVEVHFVPEAAAETDWFRREGIEPVGNVTSDAVGLSGFVAPGSDEASGYTIALVSRRQGAVIAVTGTAADRAAAEAVASLVAGSL